MFGLQAHTIYRIYYTEIEVTDFETFFKRNKIVEMCFVCISRFSDYLLFYKLYKSVSEATVID